MIHKIVKRVREQSGWTQSAVAALADVPRSQLQILEKGGNVTLETLEKVLRAMGISLAAISGEEIARLRGALREMTSVIDGLAAQATAPAAPDPHRLLEMSRELAEFVRATQGEAAAAPVLAAFEKQAAEVEQAERKRVRRPRKGTG
jgi:transcriptional regulator with XRE-family HTH domain